MKISIIIPTRNNRDRLEFLLKLLKDQTFSNIEYIVSDALSTDGTRDVARKYKTKIVNNRKLLTEPGVSIGMKAATGDLMMVLAVDNYFYDNHDIEKIVNVFKNKNIYAAFPKHNSQKNYSLYSKYINTFTDPFNHFVYWNASNARTFNRVYTSVKHNNTYDVYDFKSANVKPILAFAQGFTIRKGYIRDNNDALDDIVPILKLIQNDKEIAYVHSVSLYHDTVRDTFHFLKKMEWATSNALDNSNYGIAKRQITLSKSQQIRKIIFPFYALSIVIPTVIALIFAIKERRYIWLFHPIVTFITGYAIIKVVILRKIGIKRKISRLN